VTNKPKRDSMPSTDLQRVFETALGEIQQTEGATARRTPIFHRTSTPSRAESEKRAMSDAAYALAQLWKISPNPAR